MALNLVKLKFYIEEEYRKLIKKKEKKLNYCQTLTIWGPQVRDKTDMP